MLLHECLVRHTGGCSTTKWPNHKTLWLVENNRSIALPLVLACVLVYLRVWERKSRRKQSFLHPYAHSNRIWKQEYVFFFFLLFLPPVLNTHGPDYSLPLETAEIKNDRWAGRDKFTLCEQHSLQTDCRVCAVWPNSTSRVSRVKAKPSAAAKQIRLEMQSSARQQDRRQTDRRVRESRNNIGWTGRFFGRCKCALCQVFTRQQIYGWEFCQNANRASFPPECRLLRHRLWG